MSDQETPTIAPPLAIGNATVSTAVLRQTLAFTEEWMAILSDYINRNFREGIDFGAVKGESKNGREFTGKPTLLKPGAEKLTLAMGLRARFVQDRHTYAMAGSPPGLITLRCLLVDSAGEVAGEGRGAATLAEKNSINNAVKFAEKRAQVDAILRLGGLSGFFEQDDDQERSTQAPPTNSNIRQTQAPANRPPAQPSASARPPARESAQGRTAPAPPASERPLRAATGDTHETGEAARPWPPPTEPDAATAARQQAAIVRVTAAMRGLYEYAPGTNPTKGQITSEFAAHEIKGANFNNASVEQWERLADLLGAEAAALLAGAVAV